MKKVVPLPKEFSVLSEDSKKNFTSQKRNCKFFHAPSKEKYFIKNYEKISSQAMIKQHYQNAAINCIKSSISLEEITRLK